MRHITARFCPGSRNRVCLLAARPIFLGILGVLLFPLLTRPVYGADRPLLESTDVRLLAKQEPADLRLFVRVPLAVVRDVQFPVKDDAGYLDLVKVRTVLYAAARYWIQGSFEVYQGHTLVSGAEIVGARLSPFSDDSFNSYESAKLHFLQPPLGNGENVLWDQVWFDIEFDFPLQPASASVALLPKVSNLAARVTTQMQYVLPDNSVRSFVSENSPGLIYFEPRLPDTARQFVEYGSYAAFRNPDLLLLIFCLVLPFGNLNEIRFLAPLLAAGVSAGLLAPALGLLPGGVWVRPLLEVASAFIVLITGLANIRGRLNPGWRDMLAAVGGGVCGTFAYFDLAGKIQFSALHPWIGSVTYYLGLLLAAELTMGFLVLALPMLRFAKTRRVDTIVVSALASDIALQWLQDRWIQLRKVPWHMPVFDLNFFALLFQVLAVLVLSGGLIWWIGGWYRTTSSIHRANSLPGHDDIAT